MNPMKNEIDDKKPIFHISIDGKLSDSIFPITKDVEGIILTLPNSLNGGEVKVDVGSISDEIKELSRKLGREFPFLIILGGFKAIAIKNPQFCPCPCDFCREMRKYTGFSETPPESK